jgi:hypothetical protein
LGHGNTSKDDSLSDLHIITQIRRAFKQLLSDAVGAKHVHNFSRLATGGFQSDQYPLVVLLVTDNLRPDQEHGHSTGTVSVDIKISESVGADNPEERIDAFRLKIERALYKRGDLGFGKYSNWVVGSLSAPEFEPMADHPDSIAVAGVIPVSFNITVLTADPTKNLNP